ncbi:MAG: methyltransferase domain-containing protein [Desulfuromusa sp.]|nr:methyltransferase domain-containing protein [Desulfuromusa sp.]
MMLNRIRRTYALWKLRGDNYYCPVCKSGFITFLPGGPSKRPGALCPNCHSLERHRFLWLMLQSFWKEEILPKSGKMLHFAPEPCLAKIFKKNFEYVSADLDPKYAMVEMDITDIKFPNESFGVIICNHVLEHIPDDRKAMTELYRVLKKGGWASLQVPMKGETTLEDASITTPEGREKAFGQNDHVRWYGSDYYQRLQEAGFSTHIYKKTDLVSEEENKRFSLATENELVIVRK